MPSLRSKLSLVSGAVRARLAQWLAQWLGYGLDDPGLECRKAQDTFLSSRALRPAVGHTQRYIKWVKQPEHDVDRLPPARAEVKNERSCTSPPPYTVMAWSGTSLLFYLVSVLNLNKSCFSRSWVIAVKRTCLERYPQGPEDLYFLSELSLTSVQK